MKMMLKGEFLIHVMRQPLAIAYHDNYYTYVDHVDKSQFTSDD